MNQITNLPMHIRILINQYASSYYKNYFSKFVLKKISRPDLIYKFFWQKHIKPSIINERQIEQQVYMTHLIKKTKYKIYKILKIFENDSILRPSIIKSLNKIINKQKLLLDTLNYIGWLFMLDIGSQWLIMPSMLYRKDIFDDLFSFNCDVYKEILFNKFNYTIDGYGYRCIW